MFDTGQKWLLGEPGLAQPNPDPLLLRLVRPIRHGQQLNYPGWFYLIIYGVAPTPNASCDGQLEHSLFRELREFLFQLPDESVSRDRQAPTTFYKAFKMPFPELRLPVLDQYGFEYPLTIRQASVASIYAVLRGTVDQDNRCHCFRG
ncbi:hypothetical protein GCM10011352_18740 [Marinobacterium zhoushanense]|uniref:Uncharacterized protein n=1 Tax=Marinobacterium zhoushanense TaxID=1679163 RepID=A0ABQ1KDN8_9GAMM|nr:hypothetical protein GCM10011352_18740 [Marinobacterium zhoushanense]